MLGSAFFFGRRLARRDWVAVAALAVGLVLFVVFLQPTGGAPLQMSGPQWALGLGVVVVLMALLVTAGWRAENDLRGGLLSAAAGAGYGLTGVLFSVAGRALSADGLAGALTTWQTYAAVAAGSISFYLLARSPVLENHHRDARDEPSPVGP